MTSLSEVYEGGVGSVVDPRQRVLGVALFAAGAAMVAGAIPIATTDLAARFGLGVFEARELAGVLAGLGLPAVFVGIFAVLPAGRATRGAAAIGASVAVFGVALFAHAYPYQWISGNPRLALATTVVYSFGTLVTFWCLFVGVATFKRRNDPGGAARLEITDEGRIRVISSDVDVPGFGSVGLFGGDPGGDVPTQTNREAVQASPEPTSDGGSAVAEPDARDEELIEAVTTRGRPDEYCGNCRHFEYVRSDGEITPYCGLADHLMEDMDACEEWTPNN